MNILDRIDSYINAKYSEGKTRDDLHNTHFVTEDAVFVLKKKGKRGFHVEGYTPPYFVDMREEVKS